MNETPAITSGEEMVSLIRRPYWKKVLSAPWLWWTHFGTACRHTTVFRAARVATLFSWAFLTHRKTEQKEVGRE